MNSVKNFILITIAVIFFLWWLSCVGPCVACIGAAGTAGVIGATEEVKATVTKDAVNKEKPQTKENKTKPVSKKKKKKK